MQKQKEKQKYIDFAFVKEHADFEQVLGYYQLTIPRRSGKQLTLLCPFHDDTNPSLKVTPETRGFHCFGCGAKGNILDFVRYMEDCDLREAAEILANVCRIDLAPPRLPSNGRPRPVRKVQRAQTPADQEIEAASLPETGKPPAATHGLPNGPKADVVEKAINPPLRFALKLDPTHPYLTERVSKETIEAFGLGLCSKGSMAGRIAIPIRNEKGDLVAYAGRWPGDDGWPEGDDKYKLPTGFQKHCVLFNLDRVLDAEHLVVVEGYFGVFRLFEAGIPAVALMGSSLAPEQVELLKRTSVERIIVLLDGDAPGRAAAETVVATLAREFFVRNVVLPDDTQPDDLSPDALRELLFPPS